MTVSYNDLDNLELPTQLKGKEVTEKTHKELVNRVMDYQNKLNENIESVKQRNDIQLDSKPLRYFENKYEIAYDEILPGSFFFLNDFKELEVNLVLSQIAGISFIENITYDPVDYEEELAVNQVHSIDFTTEVYLNQEEDDVVNFVQVQGISFVEVNQPDIDAQLSMGQVQDISFIEVPQEDLNQHLVLNQEQGISFVEVRQLDQEEQLSISQVQDISFTVTVQENVEVQLSMGQ